MKTYILIGITTLKEYMAYRLNFFLWRLRMFLGMLVTFFLWFSVFEKQSHFGIYSKNILLSYILYSNLISTLTLSSRVAEIAGQLNDGSIINLLLKPVSLFSYYFSRDMADKLINVGFAIFEVSIVVFSFKAPLIPPQNVFLFLPFLFCGIFISFHINLILSFIGFWTTEVWAPRFLFFTLVFFLSGSYFPLDILPKSIYTILMFTPFPSIFFIPTKILIGQINTISLWQICTTVFWAIFLSRCSVVMWKQGNKSFSFWGR